MEHIGRSKALAGTDESKPTPQATIAACAAEFVDEPKLLGWDWRSVSGSDSHYRICFAGLTRNGSGAPVPDTSASPEGAAWARYIGQAVKSPKRPAPAIRLQ